MVIVRPTKSFYKTPSSTLASQFSPVHTRRAIRVRLVQVEAPRARAKNAFFHDKESGNKNENDRRDKYHSGKEKGEKEALRYNEIIPVVIALNFL
nr:hypothetical protein Iba_chr12aCG13160 [Ipomoea batatas]